MITLRPARQLRTGGPWFHGAPITGLDWDPRGRLVLSASPHLVRLWWAASGELVGVLPGIGGGDVARGAFRFVSGGSRVAGCVQSGEIFTLRYWETDGAGRVEEIRDGGAGRIVAIDRSRRFAVTAAAGVWLVDLESGEIIAPILPPSDEPFEQHPQILCAAIDDGATQVFLSMREDWENAIITTWDVTKRQWLGRTRPRRPVVSAAYVPGKQLVITCSGDTDLRHPETLAARGVLPGATAVAVDASGERIALSEARTTRLYRTSEIAPDAPGRVVHTAGESLAFSKDGSRFLTGGAAGVLWVRDADSGAAAPEQTAPPRLASLDETNRAAWTRDGTHVVVTTESNAAIHDGNSLEKLRDTTKDDDLRRSADPNIAPDGSFGVLSIRRDAAKPGQRVGTVVFGPGGPLLDLKKRFSDQRHGPVALSPDGRIAVSGSRMTRLIVWDPVTHDTLRTLVADISDPEEVRAVAISNDGRVAAGDRRGAIAVWRLDDGTRLLYVRPGGDDGEPIHALAFAADGRLAAGDLGLQSNLRVLDGNTGRVTALLEGHTWSVSSLAFHPSRPVLLSAGRDGCVFAWDLP